MVIGVSFGLEGGESVFCPHPSLMIFIDETGHEALSDPTVPFFGYGGCLSYAGEYEKFIGKPWKEVERAFSGYKLPLHAAKLEPGKLTGPQKAALKSFFINNVFGRFAAICSNKTIKVNAEEETIFYMIAAVHQRIEEILRKMLDTGLVFSEIFMFIEHSERTADKIVEYFSRCKIGLGSQEILVQEIPVHHYFVKKALNEPGLVVADFIAHTAGTTVRSTHEGKVSKYLARVDFQSVFTPKDSRWASFREVTEIKWEPQPEKV